MNVAELREMLESSPPDVPVVLEITDTVMSGYTSSVLAGFAIIDWQPNHGVQPPWGPPDEDAEPSESKAVFVLSWDYPRRKGVISGE